MTSAIAARAAQSPVRSPHEPSGPDAKTRSSEEEAPAFTRTKEAASRPVATSPAGVGPTALGVRLGNVEPVNLKPVRPSEVGALFGAHQRYRPSRDRFMRYAQALKALHPDAKIGQIQIPSDDADDFCISHLTIPARGEATNVKFFKCGTHGPESPYGAVMMEAFMRDQLQHVDFENTTVVFAHGVDAWGWEFDHRGTEDNVDLNRHGNPSLAGSQVFPKVRDAVTASSAPSTTALGSMLWTLKGLVQKALAFGTDATTRGMAEGQNVDPRAPLFMGEKDAELLPEIRALIDDVLVPAYAEATDIEEQDFHTGLGDSGRVYVMEVLTDPKRAAEVIAAVEGTDLIHQTKEDQRYDTSPVDSTNWSKHAAPKGARVNTMTVEAGGFAPGSLPFGFDADSLVGLLMTANVLRVRGQLHHFWDEVEPERRDEIRQAVRDLFNPDDDTWQQMVFASTNTLQDKLYKGA
ncbi:MAG: DUF2817 domain-containing protein [Deltaproteobacteria bacterium]